MAVDLRVRIAQLECGFLAMIEAPELPSVRVVAALAGRPEASTVHAGGGVAFRADDLRILESQRGMTLFAPGHGVQTEQREIRQVVLEEDVLAPGVFAVTVAATRALLAAMDVIAHVTTRAPTIDSGISGGSHVTLIASRFPMRPAKRELGRSVMIKGRHFPVSFTVTARTVLAVSPAVLIVQAMAGNTLRR